jgi:hypothetical protein
MTKISNNFLSGIVNKDDDERIIPPDTLVDTENFVVVTSEGSNAGVGKNVPGNKKITTNNFTGPEDLGSCPNKLNNNVYYFIKTPTIDYLLEINVLTNVNTIVLQSTVNTRLNLQSGKRIKNINIIYSGEEYDPVTQQGGHLITWSGDNNPPRIGNIERMKTWGLDGFTAEEIMLIKAPPLVPPTIELINTISEAENFIKDKFISFATRFKYRDGYYSAISTWQEYAFSPKVFDLDFNSKQNKGMVNSVNAINIKFTTGPREVIAIDLLFKYSNSSTVYKVDQFDKADEGWANNILIPTPILFDNSKIYQILPESQYFRSFDNVPETVQAQTLIGSRISHANYTEGKNMIDHLGNKVKMTYTVGLSSIENTIYTPTVTSLNSTSPFDASVIVKGKIRLDFTTSQLKKNSGIIIGFNLVTLPVNPPIVPNRPTDVFQGQYLFVIPQDYASITALVNDTANGFKTGLEGYFSRTLRNEIIAPPDAFPFAPDSGPLTPPYSLFNGFQLSIISTNIIEINLPTTQFEIDVVPDPNTFVNEYYTESLTQVKVETIGSKKSMKSYRSYEIAMIHKDAQGRKTTATVSEKNTVFVPVSASTKKNTILVDLITQKPPAWATTYKFAIKENRRLYEEIYISQFYEDGYYRWAKIDGENVNKVKQGDILLVKRDAFNALTVPVLTTVIEVRQQLEDFLTATGVEPAGLYAKFNPVGFQMPVDPNSYREFNASANAKSGYPTASIEITGEIPNGSVFTIKVNSSKGGTSSENNSFEKLITANADYIDFATFYNTQINPIPFQGTNTGVDFGGVYPKSLTGNTINVQGTSDGSPTVINPNRGFIDMNITLRTTSGMLIFETLGEEISDGIFYETPDVFSIVGGEYTINAFDEPAQLSVVNGVHSLEKTFNCFVQGNGAESYQILDAFNAKYLSIDFCPTAVSENEYRQINRFADITYSEPYNTNTSVNRLNEFNLSLGNFKDDVEKSFGPIWKINGLDTNLEVFQEDKDSIVYYGKDLLYNADGTTNLTGIPQVLGEQKTYEGEYGISTHPESYARYGYDTYHTDVKRGVVIKKSNNGLFEISSQGMTNYFKKLFRDTTILAINGEFDVLNKMYVLNIKYEEASVTKYVTWFYSDKANGWITKMSFNPADMCAINNHLISFNSGEVYLHNQIKIGIVDNYNTFYGVQYPSSFEFNFSQFPSERKVFKTIDIEGTTPLAITAKTNLSDGYINSVDFEKKEGFFYSYLRNSNAVLDTKLLSTQGIGNATIVGLTLNFAFEVDPIISLGDKILNLSMALVGTVVSRTKNSLTLDTVNSIVSGNYVLCSKSQSIQANSMLGYYMNVKASFNSTAPHEIFAINSEIFKSFP